MKFDDLDAQMRAIETARDISADTAATLVARIDGRSFTRLTKEVHDLDRPFDINMRDWMLTTVEHLMQCGFRVKFGYTQSDEISLLFDPNEQSYGRKLRKWNSVLAGEASGAFSLQAGRPAAFDCRIIELIRPQLVVDYFRWRAEDAKRNAINAHCYWILRDKNLSATGATSQLEALTTDEKLALLKHNNRPFESLPLWHSRGSGVIWQATQSPAKNPLTGEQVVAQRKKLCRITELPERDDYSSFIEQQLK